MLAVAAGDAVEIVEDFRAANGVVKSEVDGELVETELAREDLRDYKAVTPPLVLDSSYRVVGGEPSGAPAGLVTPLDPLATAALIGPPFVDDLVDEGDAWTYTGQDDVLATVTIDVEIVGEVELPDGRYAYAIEFTGSATEAPVPIDLRDVPGLTGSAGGAPLDDFLPPGISSTATVLSALLEGSAIFDPDTGVHTELETLLSLTLEFTAGGGAGESASFTLDSTAFRSGELTSLQERATVFEIEGVLDRFQVDAFTLAAEAILGVPGYDVVDAGDREAQEVFGVLSDIRQDLFPGATIRRLVDESGRETVIASMTMGGDLRGAPSVAEDVAGFLAGVSPRPVSIGDFSAYRATIGSSGWLLYNNETHLFVVIGDDAGAERALAAVVANAAPYLWQPGDCFDFTDGFFDGTPYAPFGLHGARHCSIDHVYEVIHSEVLSDGPGDAFPDDMTERSNLTCGRAFNEFSGTSELESELAMIRYLPDAEEWAKGSRYLACVVFRTGPEGELAVSGRLDGRDPSFAFTLEAGTCLFDLFPVDCDDPHNGEVIAVLELAGGPDAPLPETEEIKRVVGDGCDAAFAEFELGSGPGVVVVRGLSDAALTWEFGTRRYYCVGAAIGTDGFELDVTGTFTDGWKEAQERVTA